MPQNLLLIESPGKIRKLSQILGSNWLVKASMGHIRELAKDGEDALGFDLDGDEVHCRYVARDQRAKDTIKQLKAYVKQVDKVVLATDYDREGETIAWHLQQVLKLKNPQRVVYGEITPTAVQQGLAHPQTLDMNLVNSGLARACLDKLVGFKGSPLLWSLNNGAKSMGRVQSATLHLICLREQEIQSFQATDYWTVFVDYQEGFRAFYRGEQATTDADDPEQDSDDAAEQKTKTVESRKVFSLAEAERLVSLAQTLPHQVVSVESKTTRKRPPAPFTTATLQQAAGSRLKFSPEKTMTLAQHLYEKGLITYMRTDSVHLSSEFCAAVKQWLRQKDPDNLTKTGIRHRSSKTAQEAHEAIRPTDINRPSTTLKADLSADEFQLYLMIWLRAVASQCQPARIGKTLIITRSGSVHWQAKGQVVTFLGYARYWKDLNADSHLPVINTGQLLTCQQASQEKKQTQPPPRYSEPKLIQLMERRGIGRPSTYAPIVKTLKQRHYIELQKKLIHPTPLGMEVDCFLKKVLPDLLEADFTAAMERTLDQIAEGQQNWQNYLTHWYRTYFAKAIEQAQQFLKARPQTAQTQSISSREKSDILCPSCGSPLSKIPSQSKKLSKPFFLKCEAGCDVVMFYNRRHRQWEQPVDPSQRGPERPQKLSSHLCPVCRQPLEEYEYTKEGQLKTLLRCSNPKARHDKKHKGVVFFASQGHWWSKKYGELPLSPSD